MKDNTKTARIIDTFLGIDDHGIFTLGLTLEREVGIQGFGYHNLQYKKYGIKYLRKILETLEADSWESLNGMYLRCYSENSLIKGIGHIVKDKWFNPEQDLDK